MGYDLEGLLGLERCHAFLLFLLYGVMVILVVLCAFTPLVGIKLRRGWGKVEILLVISE